MSSRKEKPKLLTREKKLAIVAATIGFLVLEIGLISNLAGHTRCKHARAAKHVAEHQGCDLTKR